MKNNDLTVDYIILSGHLRMISMRMLLIFACFIVPLFASAASVVINRKNHVTIDGTSYTSSTDDCLAVTNSTNIVIKNANFVNCFGVGISIENSSNVMITMSNFKNLNGGVYALNSSSISVVANNFKNMFSTFLDSARGQFVQFNNVTGKGNIVQFNKGVNEPGNSYPEDAVNLFQSSGTPTSPITINNNCFSGGGPSLSGGGIVTGDWGGANQVVKNNTLINVGQFGIGVAGGTKIKILNNSIYGARQVGFTNIGIYVWNQTSPPSCSDIQVERNRVDYTNSAGENNPYWNAGNCGTVTGESHNTFYGLDLSNLACPF